MTFRNSQLSHSIAVIQVFTAFYALKLTQQSITKFKKHLSLLSE